MTLFKNIIIFLQNEQKNAVNKYAIVAYENIINTLLLLRSEEKYKINHSETEEELRYTLNKYFTKHMVEKIIDFNYNDNDKYNNKQKQIQEHKIIHNIEHKTDKNHSIYEQLLKISGIGTVKAKNLISDGVKKISDLKNKKIFSTLSYETQLFLTYKPENIIKRSIIKKIDDINNIIHLCHYITQNQLNQKLIIHLYKILNLIFYLDHKIHQTYHY